jgi:hypothetical protein
MTDGHMLSAGHCRQSADPELTLYQPVRHAWGGVSCRAHSCPSVQLEQAVDHPREKVLGPQSEGDPVVVGHSLPAGHGVQPTSDTRLYVPAAQAVCATVLQAKPAGQGVQLEEAAAANSPGPQTTGPSASAHLKPAGQVVHAAAPGRLYLPALQVTGACPARQNEPAAQATHLEPGDPETHVPFGHVEQSTTTPPELNVFAGQITGMPDTVGHFLPAGQAVHAAWFAALVVPGWQVLQAGSPRWLKVPAEHGVAEVWSQELPAGQATQLPFPDAIWNVPIGHAVQFTPPGLLNVPGAQALIVISVDVVPAFGQKCPASHVMHISSECFEGRPTALPAYEKEPRGQMNLPPPSAGHA